EGHTLQQEVESRGPRPEADVLVWARDICSVMRYLHTHDPPIIFRDLKPSNLIWSPGGKIFVIDFGIVKVVDAASGGRTQVHSRGYGSRGYAPPEQYSQGSDARTDIYALGATLYFLLTGQVPPPSLDLVVGRATLVPISEVLPQLSPRVVRAIEHMMSLSRGDRPVSIDEVIHLLFETSSSAAVGPVSTPDIPTSVMGQTAAPRPSTLSGILHHRYRVDRLLGEGGMSSVYLATHLELDVRVAVKEMRPPPADRETMEACVRQFRTEARVLSRLNHPNLPRVYDFFEAEGRYYIVMDYIRGSTLEDVGTVSEAQALKWAGTLCDVLEYLHQNDPPVIFRDLKPANIMLGRDGTLWLIDFGIVKVFEQDKGALTETVLRGAVSHGFAAPEQYGIGGTDAGVDIYALGATLYYLLTRQVLPSSVELAAGIAELPPLRKLRPDVSERTESAVEWMMAVVRERRPANMAEVRRALGRGDQGLDAGTLPQQVRWVMREELQHFFPIPTWMPRGTLLQDVLAALTGVAQVVVLHGPPGAGKTRLLREIAQNVDEEFKLLPFVAGNWAHSRQPFSCLAVPFGWMLQDPEVLQAALQQLEPRQIRELAVLLPQLQPYVEGWTAQQLSPDERTVVLLRAFQALLMLVAPPPKPILLCIDDAHRLDPASLLFLDVLRDDEACSRYIHLVLTMEPSRGSVAETWLERLRGAAGVLEISIPPLSQEEIGQYIKLALPSVEGMSAALPALFAASGGNPQMVEELLRFLIMRRAIEEKAGRLVLSNFKAESLPRRVIESVRRRIELLPIDTQEVLEAASAIGSAFHPRILATLLSHPLETVEASLQRASEAVFVEPTSQGWYDFISESTRQAFYEHVWPDRRQRLHRTLSDMEKQVQGVGAAAAFHDEQAGDLELAEQYLSRFASVCRPPVEGDVGKGVWDEAEALDEQQLGLALHLLSALGRALKSLQSFEPGSAVARTSLLMVHRALQLYFAEVSMLAVVFAEKTWRVN
ncbi:MAG: protein kinase domain-containing protein, partial [Candidatus Xenobia bacterium]